MTNPTYIVAGCKPWCREVFDETIKAFPGQWHYADDPATLTRDYVESVKPRYVFFLHWSWRVDQHLIDAYECVCFHMTDLPFGRGGSPLQNLILRGHNQTVLSAFRMVEEMDAGPIYAKSPLSLEGRAGDIYRRASETAAEMIRDIIDRCPAPTAQEGEPTHFTRRVPADSCIAEVGSLGSLYYFIRMLDAETYPRAYIEQGGYRYSFQNAALDGGKIQADVTIEPIKDQKL